MTPLKVNISPFLVLGFACGASVLGFSETSLLSIGPKFFPCRVPFCGDSFVLWHRPLVMCFFLLLFFFFSFHVTSLVLRITMMILVAALMSAALAVPPSFLTGPGFETNITVGSTVLSIPPGLTMSQYNQWKAANVLPLLSLPSNSKKRKSMAPRATGGPDAFGYTWQDAIGSIQLVDLSATGTLALPGISDDSHQGLLPLPFSFNFYGTNYNTFSVGTNGVVYFEDAYLGLANQCPLPAAQSYTPQRFIAVYHDDLIVRGGIYYQSFSTCPIGCASACLLIHFDNMDNFGSSGDNMQFNVALYPDGSILVIYGETGPEEGSGATAGLQGDPTTNALQYSCNSVSLFDGLAIGYQHPAGRQCLFGIEPTE